MEVILYLTVLGEYTLLNKTLIYEAVNIITNKYSKYSDLFEYRITTNCRLMDDEYTHNLNRISINKIINYETIFLNCQFKSDKLLMNH